MPASKGTRLFKLASQINIGKDAIVEFLQGKGFTIENKPTSVLNDEMVDVVMDKFAREAKAAEKQREKLEKYHHARNPEKGDSEESPLTEEAVIEEIPVHVLPVEIEEPVMVESKEEIIEAPIEEVVSEPEIMPEPSEPETTPIEIEKEIESQPEIEPVAETVKISTPEVEVVKEAEKEVEKTTPAETEAVSQEDDSKDPKKKRKNASWKLSMKPERCLSFAA